MQEITNINQVKNLVLVKVARYAYDNTLNDKADNIPYEIIEGIKPNFRCCVYREREIVRQRVRLSMGKLPMDTARDKPDPAQIVHVIPSACEDCHITRFTVTSNCHNCLTKSCIKTCKFGAIMKTPHGAFIDKLKCKECGRCVGACPYHAIVDIERPCKKSCPVDAIEMDVNDLAVINTDKCINCGACIEKCPFAAISDISMLSDVIQSINENNHVYAMLAPSIEGQFGDIPIGEIKNAVKKLGFRDAVEVALGADAVALREAEELLSRMEQGKTLTSSCCPSFVNYIELHFPELKPYVSTTISPMVATARYIKTIDPEAVTAFIGPCVAKKNESVKFKDDVNFVLTFDELQAMLHAKEICFDGLENDGEDSTSYGKGFAKSGGVSNAISRAIKEKGLELDIKTAICNGIEDCRKELLMMKAGKSSSNFVEGMVCQQGCINGPVQLKSVNEAKRVFEKYADNQIAGITENNVSKSLDRIDIRR